MSRTVSSCKGQLVDPGATRRGADDIPQHLGRHAVSPHAPNLVDGAEHRPRVMAAAAVHASTAFFTHVGIGTVRTCPALPTKSAITQCSSRCRIDSEAKANSSARRKPQPINTSGAVAPFFETKRTRKGL
jgi:hypothetical protein